MKTPHMMSLLLLESLHAKIGSAQCNRDASYVAGLRAAYDEARIFLDADAVKLHSEECKAALAVDAILRRRAAAR